MSTATAKQPPVPADDPLTLPAVSVGADLKILSWNIYMLPGIVPLKARLSRARSIADTLVQSDYDIVVFQEAFHAGAVRILAARLRARYPFMYGPFNADGASMRYSSGVWVLSRTPLRLLGTIEFGDARNFDRTARKGAALLEGEHAGRTFQVLGTHLQAGDLPSVRAHQFQELYTDLLTRYHRDGVPQIICGDMNTGPDEEAYCDMLHSLDAEDGAPEGAQRESYDGTTNRLAERVWRRARTTLDYVLLRVNGTIVRSVRRTVSVMKR
ncbi:MAG TPA: endonuclease/exonuclease/phosphatase family protein, partial [Flavobacteriales bacterium]|nr:endonuclease/exonuclease/phosphatase family protein [Flavobacteriales bacterium]